MLQPIKNIYSLTYDMQQEFLARIDATLHLVAALELTPHLTMDSIIWRGTDKGTSSYYTIPDLTKSEAE